MTSPPISRRALLLASAAAAGCGRKKATGYPGYCFVANQKSRTVSAIDLNRFRVRKQIQLDAAPTELVARPDSDSPRVFALAPDSGVIYDIDVATLAVGRKTWAGNQAAAMRLAQDNAQDNAALWVLYREPAAMVELPLSTFRPGRRIPLPAVPDSFDLSTDGRAAVASRKGKSIAIVSLARAAVERVIDAGCEPSLIQFRKDGRQVLAASAAARNLSIFDVETGKTVVRLPLPLAPRNFCLSADEGQLFITGDGMDAVVIVSPYQTQIDQTVLAGHTPGAMAVTSSSPSYLLIANPVSNSITALDIYTRTLVAVAQVGSKPTGVVVTPDNQYALVIDSGSGDLAVVRLSSFTEAWVRRYRTAPLFTMIPVGENPVSAALVGFRA